MKVREKQSPAMGSDGLPSTGFVREPVILTVLPVGRGTWWAGVKDGRYPPGVKLSTRVTAWPVDSIRALIKELSQSR